MGFGNVNAAPSATRTDDFTDVLESGMEFKYFQNKEADTYSSDGGKNGYLISLPADKTKAQQVMDQLCDVDFSYNGT